MQCLRGRRTGERRLSSHCSQHISALCAPVRTAPTFPAMCISCSGSYNYQEQIPTNISTYQPLPHTNASPTHIQTCNKENPSQILCNSTTMCCTILSCTTLPHLAREMASQEVSSDTKGSKRVLDSNSQYRRQRQWTTA